MSRKQLFEQETQSWSIIQSKKGNIPVQKSITISRKTAISEDFTAIEQNWFKRREKSLLYTVAVVIL